MAITNATGTVFLLFLSPFLVRAAWVAISRSQSRATTSPTDYSRLPQFANYDVGEGFLLDVKEGNSIEFTVEAALTKSHPLHHRTLWAELLDVFRADPRLLQPIPSGAKIVIIFPNVRSVCWVERTMEPIGGPDGSVDYGNIDCFTVEGDWSHLSGEWGEIEIVSDPIEVTEIE
jgi:hypothetical protein